MSADELVDVTRQLGDLVRVSRRDTRLRQDEAARAAGISARWLSAIETGKVRRTKADTMAFVLDAVKADPRQVRALGFPLIAHHMTVLGDRDPNMRILREATAAERAILVTVLETMREVAATKGSEDVRQQAG